MKNILGGTEGESPELIYLGHFFFKCENGKSCSTKKLFKDESTLKSPGELGEEGNSKKHEIPSQFWEETEEKGCVWFCPFTDFYLGHINKEGIERGEMGTRKRFRFPRDTEMRL